SGRTAIPFSDSTVRRGTQLPAAPVEPTPEHCSTAWPAVGSRTILGVPDLRPRLSPPPQAVKRDFVVVKRTGEGYVDAGRWNGSIGHGWRGLDPLHLGRFIVRFFHALPSGAPVCSRVCLWWRPISGHAPGRTPPTGRRR